MSLNNNMLCKERIFLTGGTGFFGRALLRHWSERASIGSEVPEVSVLSRDPDAFQQRYPEFRDLLWLRFCAGDIMEPTSLPEGEGYSHVLHAAADSTLGQQLVPLRRYDQIVDGTRNLLEFSRRCGARRFLLTSSGGVYGPQPPGMERIAESYCGMPDPLVPAYAYSVAKRAAEHLCALYQDSYGIETVIARCFAFVGEDLPLDAHFAIGNFIRDALAGAEIVIAGDGSPLRSYLDQRDLAVWLLTMLERGTPGSAYNVGSDTPISISSLAELVRDTVAPDTAVRVLGEKIPGNFRSQYVPDTTRARVELRLNVSVSLADAIRHSAVLARKRMVPYAS